MNSAEAVTPTNSTTTLSISSNNSASVELLVKSDSGTFASSTSSQKLNFNVKTDNYAGYELTLLGKDSTYNELKNSSTNTTLTSISGSKESSEFSNGNWGYTLDGTNYRAAPNNTTGYQIEKTSTPNKDTAKTYTLGIGAKANYSTKAGTYTNTYVLTAVGNSTPYTIYYRDNTNDSSVANLPTTQEEATSATKVNLSSVTPTRTGYTFSKWCDEAVSNNGTTCSGTSYSSGDEFGIDRTAASNVTTLYAVWTVNSYTINITNNNTTSNPATNTTINFGGETTITVTPNAGYYLSEVSCPTGYTCSGYNTGSDVTGAQTVTVKNNGDSTSAVGGVITFAAVPSMGSLQDFTANECSAMATGTTDQLKDSRDGQTYTIAKLADDNCWMTSNLNLAGGTELTSDDTDMPSNYVMPTANGFRSGNKLPASSTTGFNSSTKAFVYNSDSTSCGDSSPCYSYYSWTAATLGSELPSSSSGYGTDVQVASICPKGWRLPTSGVSNLSSAADTKGYKKGDFYKLAVQYDMSSSSYYQDTVDFYNQAGSGTVPNFLLAGYYYNGSLRDGGAIGKYWSSTPQENTSNAYFLNLSPDSVSTAKYTSRSYGHSVRCVKKSSSEEVVSSLQGTYLQDVTPTVANMLTTNTILTLKDSRDEQSYQVAKLADGNLWMVDNLNLGAVTLTKDLTKDNTNCYATGEECVASALSNVTLTADIFNDWKKTSGTQTYTAAELIPVSGSDSMSNTFYGTLYNYCATSAGTICSSYNVSDAVYDICPRGWRLPISSELSINLYYNVHYNSYDKARNAITNDGAAFAVAGSFSNGTPVTNNKQGTYWSSSYQGSDGVYSLTFIPSSSTVYSPNTVKRNLGHSVRCVLNDDRTIAEATYMQDVTTQMVTNTANNTTATLKDLRDGSTYNVAKLNGNLWMTQNLRYVGDTVNAISTSTSMIMKKDTSDIATNKVLAIGDLTSGDSTKSRIHVVTSDQVPSGATYTATDMGVWYNYNAASAGTDAYQSVCPKNWTLPTGNNGQQSTIASGDYLIAFSPITGGDYHDGSVANTGTGYWWSSTNSSYTSDRYYLSYSGNSGAAYTKGSLQKSYGLYIRCILPAAYAR